MDFSHAGFLIVFLAALLYIADQLRDPKTRVRAIVAIIIGQVATWFVAYSAWGHDSVVAGKALDNLPAFSLAVVGVGATVIALLFHDLLIKHLLGAFSNAISNIGENNGPPPGANVDPTDHTIGTG